MDFAVAPAPVSLWLLTDPPTFPAHLLTPPTFFPTAQCPSQPFSEAVSPLVSVSHNNYARSMKNNEVEATLARLREVAGEQGVTVHAKYGWFGFLDVLPGTSVSVGPREASPCPTLSTVVSDASETDSPPPTQRRRRRAQECDFPRGRSSSRAQCPSYYIPPRRREARPC